ncbi:MAG: hypothetical protein LBE34_02425 [Flavobacteriaceae bacterium]|jgi:hypothetical protein|nr:hypothetical protein [Flavobacteriaceae bacterium]
MIKKFFFILTILVGYFFYRPVVIQFNDFKSPTNFTFKPNQVIDLNDILSLEEQKDVTIYIALNDEERTYFNMQVPKWKVLKTKKIDLIKELFSCKFRYTGGDVSTVQSKLYIYSGSKLVFESEISLEEHHLGLQNSYTGWASCVNDKDLLKIIAQFDRYNLPILVIQ